MSAETDDSLWRWLKTGERPGKAASTARPAPTPATGDITPYAQSALAREFQSLATTAEGSRNDQLNASAFNIGQLVGGGQIPESLAREQLTFAARQCGLSDSEIAPTLRSGLDAGKSHPRYPDPQGGIVPDVTIISADGETDTERSRFAPLLLNRSALRSLPDPEPLIADTLDQGTVALLYGKWATCKTFIALDWSASIATGRAWQGRATEKRRVLYVAAEGAFGMKSRVDAWETGWHTTIVGDDFEILPRPVNLTSPADVVDLAALIDWRGYGFIVFDTLARCMVGADENSAKDCGLVVDRLTMLRERTPAGRGAVLAVHHTGKDGKTFRGSSVFEAGADTVYAVSADGGTTVLEREKRKDGPQDDRHELRLDLVEGTGSGVMSAHRGHEQNGQAHRLLTIFVENFTATGASKADLRAVADMPPSTFHRAINELVQSGELINSGTAARPFYKYQVERGGL